MQDAGLKLRDVQRGVVLPGKTGENGNFEFPTIPIGQYELTVERTGFRTQNSPRFVVAIGARQRVDFRLEVETVQSAVEVTAEVSLVESESSNRGQRIESQQIRDTS